MPTHLVAGTIRSLQDTCEQVLAGIRARPTLLAPPRRFLGTDLLEMVDGAFAEASRVRRELIEDRCLRSGDARALSLALLDFSRAVSAALDVACGNRSLACLRNRIVRARLRRRLNACLTAWRAERVSTLTFPFGKFLRGRVA